MRFYVFVCLAILWGVLRSAGGGSSSAFGPQKLTVSEEPNRVVMRWSGEVMPPMKERFEEAFKKLGSNPRRVLISLDSPGGSVDHGNDVIDVIVKNSRVHYIDTIVESKKMCASMCVPLYLTGVERLAAKDARFMFHQVSFRGLGGMPFGGELGRLKRQAVNYHTDKLFGNDFEGRLNNVWLEEMRERIRRGDVWLTGRQLMDEQSGVVDKLL